MENRLPSDKPLTLDRSDVPPRAGPELFIMRLKGGEFFTFILLADELYGINIHFGNGSSKSSPHFTDKNRCPGCQANTPMRWKGYLHAFCSDKGQEVFLELTPASAQSLIGQLPGGKLRGNRIQVKRTKGDNGRLLISVLTACSTIDALPKAKDPEESLLRLWGYADGLLPAKPVELLIPSSNGFH